MENGHISSLFQKIKAHLQKNLAYRKAIVRIVNEEARLGVLDNDIELKKGILSIRTSPLKRTQLMLKKEAILARIASETGQTVLDIR